MEGQQRREQIVQLLSEGKEPLSGGYLARKFGVSRQVIVQDVALLRATNKHILSTTKGYLLYLQKQGKRNRCFCTRHSTGQIKDELCTIVDHGGNVLDVIVSHEIYGEIRVDLMIVTRQEVMEFVGQIEQGKVVPLKELTNGLHYHTVEADSEEILDKIEKALKEKLYLVE